MRTANGLLAGLAEADYEAIYPRIERVDLPQAMLLSGPHETDQFCYFLFSGIGSTVAISSLGRPSEVGLFGREGMSPGSAILGSDSNPYRVIMQVEGEGARIRVPDLRAALQERREMRRIFYRWAQAAALQVSYTALANANHTIEQRLARWVLMCQDRCGTEIIKLTHEFLAIMLSVRRPSVTTSLNALESKQLIYAERGTVIVRDRVGLEKLAADSYGGSEAEYRRLMGHVL